VARAGKYYEAGEGRAAQVEALFARIAPRYDLINDLQSAGLHRLWKRRLVALADVPDGGRALDLCCGTGDVVRALARAYPRAGSIAGLDFTMPMLQVALARRRMGSSVGYLQADALRIPAPDASFDRVTIAYGLRNVADLRACLAEVRRVLRPGGRFVALEFGKPPNAAVARAYFAYLRIVVPLFGRIFFGDPDTHGYILDSLRRYPSQQEVADLLRAAGFSRVRVENPLLGIMGIHAADV
jgi:demethylmenaquinone methyltransferase / 2-methoxy-6-polyprenyl-1,4-benzoquinol methylase